MGTASGAYVTLIHKITVEMTFKEEKKYVTSFVEGPTAMLQFLESVVDTVAHTVHIYMHSYAQPFASHPQSMYTEALFLDVSMDCHDPQTGV